MPQKKHFSSPDDLQMRLAARKNQHQQLAIATAQNALQPMRKSANDFYATGSPQFGQKKVMVVLKPRNGSPGQFGIAGKKVGASTEANYVSAPHYQGVNRYRTMHAAGGDEVEEGVIDEMEEDH